MPEQEKAANWLLEAQAQSRRVLMERFQPATDDDYDDEVAYDPRTQWKQKDGTVINIADMEDSHLKATREMLFNIETRLQSRLNDTRRKKARFENEIDRRRKLAQDEERRIQAEAKKAADAAYAAAYAQARAKLSAPERPIEGRKFRV